jgi:hypothetical protein
MQPEKPFQWNMMPFCKRSNSCSFLQLDNITHEHLEGFILCNFYHFFYFLKTRKAIHMGGGAGGKSELCRRHRILGLAPSHRRHGEAFLDHVSAPTPYLRRRRAVPYADDNSYADGGRRRSTPPMPTAYLGRLPFWGLPGSFPTPTVAKRHRRKIRPPAPWLFTVLVF